jgi:hypothetical protein
MACKKHHVREEVFQYMIQGRYNNYVLMGDTTVTLHIETWNERERKW